MQLAEISGNESFDNPLRWFPDIEMAIERQPIIVAPDTLLIDVISLISQSHDRCPLWTISMVDDGGQEASAQERLAGCVLVMQGAELQGILTERDVVRLTANATNFATVTVSAVMTSPVVTIAEQSVQDIFAALFLLRRYRIRHLPVLDSAGSVVGVISHSSLRKVLRPANLLRFRRVVDVMTTQIVQASLNTPILRLAQLMAKHQVSCIVITQRNANDNSRPVGIVTERDIVQFQSLQLDLVNTRASELMSTPLFLLNPQDSLWLAQQEMQKRHVGRLVVSWNWGQNLGIVTQTSLLRVFDPMEMYSVIENLQQTIQELKVKIPATLCSDDERLSTVSLPPIAPTEPCDGMEQSTFCNRDNSLREVIGDTLTKLEAVIAGSTLSPEEIKIRLLPLTEQLKSVLLP